MLRPSFLLELYQFLVLKESDGDVLRLNIYNNFASHFCQNLVARQTGRMTGLPGSDYSIEKVPIRKLTGV